MFNLTPFRFWCQKVLPLVYDDSLSYYELLCKVIDYLNKMGEDVREFAELLSDYNLGRLVGEKLDEMAADGTLDRIIARYINYKGVIVDVSTMVEDKILTNDNIGQAILDAIDVTGYIYIPEGEYTFNETISKDCTIFLNKDAVIKSAIQKPALSFEDCSASIYGGTFCSGEDNNSREFIGYPTSYEHDGDRAIVRFVNCHNCIISGIYSPYSKHWDVLYFKNCHNIEVNNSVFRHSLNSSIYFHRECRQVAVRNCKFTDNYYAIDGNSGNPRYFCYFVYTGDIENKPVGEEGAVDGLIYENNYCENSEDSALDTHGARNVIIRNNTIINCVCSITAYNDNVRMRRGSWKMENILIENNYCKSNRSNNADTNYRHPFVLLGAVNGYSITDEDANDNPGNYNAFSNCVVKNNTFISTTSNIRRGIQFNTVSRNVVFENNTVDLPNATYAVGGSHMINAVFKNNNFISNNKINFDYNCCVEIDGGEVNSDSDYLREFINSKGMLPILRAGTVNGGGTIAGANNEFSVSQGYGRRLNEFYTGTDTFTVNISNKIVYLKKHCMLPYMSLYVTKNGVRTATYIDDIIDFDYFRIANDVEDGEYELTLRRNFTYDNQVNLIPAIVTPVSGTGVNVRSAPNNDAEIIGTLSSGDVCLTLARNVGFYNDDFRYIVYGNQGLVGGYCWGASITPLVPTYD